VVAAEAATTVAITVLDEKSKIEILNNSIAITY
jgi:hypothetical protein